MSNHTECMLYFRHLEFAEVDGLYSEVLLIVSRLPSHRYLVSGTGLEGLCWARSTFWLRHIDIIVVVTIR